LVGGVFEDGHVQSLYTINVEFVFSLMILISSFHGRLFVFPIFLHMHIYNIKNPNLVVKPKFRCSNKTFWAGEPIKHPQLCTRRLHGRRGKKIKEKETKKWHGKERKKKYWDMFSGSSLASWFFTGKKGFFDWEQNGTVVDGFFFFF
jgi:hypothetical protein